MRRVHRGPQPVSPRTASEAGCPAARRQPPAVARQGVDVQEPRMPLRRLRRAGSKANKGRPSRTVDRALSSVRPTEVQAWAKGLPLAPSGANVVYGVLRGLMRAAVEDRLITS